MTNGVTDAMGGRERLPRPGDTTLAPYCPPGSLSHTHLLLRMTGTFGTFGAVIFNVLTQWIRRRSTAPSSLVGDNDALWLAATTIEETPMLMQSDTELARKLLAFAFAAGHQTRRSFLAKLLDEVAGRHTISLDYVAIRQALDISPEDARALCPSVREKITKRHLTRRALNVLCYCHHADIVGKTIDKRATHLVEIAPAHTSDELFYELGLGQVSMTEIHLCLDERGASPRFPH